MKFNTKVVVGAQWGDEGKGKISNYLAQSADIIVRYQGGNNAGHSIVIDNKRFALQHLPSGILNENSINVLAQGMVINPPKLIEELEQLKKGNISNYQLFISDRAHIILPYHIQQDKMIENIKKENSNTQIGTTKKGIGPCYEDKYARIGIRFADFINEVQFKEKLESALLIKNKIFKGLDLPKFSAQKIFDEYKEYAKILKPFVIEVGIYLEKAINANKKIIFEGAQGSLLCIENGSYPYVTSSSPNASSVALSTGINFKYIKDVMGIVKAYSTRVGEGPMPSEIKDQKINDYIRTTGNEFGTVTGRARRIGWLDLVSLKHSIRVGGLTEITVTLLDVLDQLRTIKIAYKYFLDQKEIDYIPASINDLAKVQTEFLTLKGWQEDTSKVKDFKDLPKNAQIYLNTIEDILKVKIKMVSVGSDRSQTFEVSK